MLLCLALFDFVPTIAFLIVAYYLVRIVYLVRGKACGALALAGALLIFLGGFLQAIWKLLFTTGAADVRLMSNLQFVLLAPGFVALLAAVILLARGAGRKTPPPVLSLAPWKLPFLIVMTLASLAAQGLLAYIAFRRRAIGAGVGFVIAFLCLLGMGGMAGGEQTVARQWIEEGVNAIGQIAFAAGSILLYRDFKAHAC
jgi:hypothetical protein